MNIFNYRHRKVGGLHFVRLGRLQFSFCLCRSFEKQETCKAKPAHSGAIVVPYVRRYEGGSTVAVYRDR